MNYEGLLLFFRNVIQGFSNAGQFLTSNIIFGWSPLSLFSIGGLILLIGLHVYQLINPL